MYAYKGKMKQYHIDNGFIGGCINSFLNSMWVFNLITPINTIMILQIYLKGIGINIPILYILISTVILLFVWVIINFSFFEPTMIIQRQRQAVSHNNPMMEEIKKINAKLDNYEILIKKGR